MLASFQTFTPIQIMTSGGPLELDQPAGLLDLPRVLLQRQVWAGRGAVDHAVPHHAGADDLPVHRGRAEGILRMNDTALHRP